MIKKYTDGVFTFYEQPVADISDDTIKYLEQYDPLYLALILAENKSKKEWNQALERGCFDRDALQRVFEDEERAFRNWWEEAQKQIKDFHK